MSVEITPPFQVFGDVDGEPLEDGYIHIGEVNQNPQSVPISVFWDEALTIPAAQPIRTLGGYPSRSGTPARMHASQSEYSISVSNKNGTLIYSSLSNQGIPSLDGAAQVTDSIASLRALPKDGVTTIIVAEYSAGVGPSLSTYRVDLSDTTSADDGVDVIVGTDGGRWKLLDTITTVKQGGVVANGVADDSSPLLFLANSRSVDLPDGTVSLNSGLTLTTPGRLSGNGARTIVKASSVFPASPIFTISPTVGSDPKDWLFENFKVSSAGAATNTFLIDIATAGKYVSKLVVRGIIAMDQTSLPFFELLNPVNVDGLFTSVLEDNWSFGGYYLDNIGDSVVLQRNTVTGVGLGYYINQLPTASHIIIRDGNNTSSGGALGVAFGFNITFDNMQCECPSAFTGANDAVVWANNDGSALVTNLRITNSNINTQNNPTNCIYLNHTDGAVIDGCSLFCHPTLGQHITLDTNARNTYIGNNKYFSSVDGTEIAPRIVDTGPGTQGVVRAATLATWTTLIDPVNGFPAGFTKSRDGLVTLRGNLTGAASTAGQTLYTLPIGFRPSAKAHVFVAYANGAASQQALVQVLPTGEVQFITTGATTVYLDGMCFSTKA